MALRVYDVQQRDDQWYKLRCGMLTASTIGKLISQRRPAATEYPCSDCGADVGGPCLSKARTKGEPTPIKTVHPARTELADADDTRVLEVAATDTARDLTAALAAEQITGHVEPSWQTSDMLRGVLDEPPAREAYAKHTGQPVTEVGFMVRDDWGFPIGYSPDGLVGDDGLIEIKSRNQKKQLQTVVADAVPVDVMAQIQCGLLVAARSWCDYVSFSGGMPLWPHRVEADPRWQDALVAAAATHYDAARVMGDSYRSLVEGLPMTERIDHDLEIRI